MSYPYHQNVAPGSSYIAPQQLMMNHAHAPTVQSPQARRSGRTPDLATLLPGRMMVIFPRRREYCGPPSFPSITFSAQGKPGLYLRDLLKNKYDYSLDGARDPVFEHHAWKITKCSWRRPHRGRVVDSNQGQWSLGKVYYGDIRILALSYYHRVWVPIIAMDAS
ncbi:hypothetical protein BD779DRAFT_1524371 [Infundibulicybe gibba]|nr:hypothetical protein BD779DRAFT_1524371 [Infundibulicybe gibba]